MENEDNDKDILHVTHGGTVWDLVAAAYITVRRQSRKQELKEQLKGMNEREALAAIDQCVALIDTSGIQKGN